LLRHKQDLSKLVHIDKDTFFPCYLVEANFFVPHFELLSVLGDSKHIISRVPIEINHQGPNDTLSADVVKTNISSGTSDIRNPGHILSILIEIKVHLVILRYISSPKFDALITQEATLVVAGGYYHWV
jgi:hypothetical protein